MPDLIDRAALMKAIQKEAVNAMELNANRYCESALTFGHCYSMVKKAPAVDAVEVEALKAWLYEIAMNNTSNYLGDACEEIISRLDGLRVFARERRTDATD